MGYLSDLERRRIAAGLLAVAVLIGIMAATDFGPFSDPPTPEQQVAAVVEQFYGAASDGDFDAYCNLLTKQAQERIEQNAARLIDNTGISGCSEILQRFGKPLEDGQLRMHEVSVSGNLARVEVSYPTASTKGPQPHTVLLQMDKSGWHVSDPG